MGGFFRGGGLQLHVRPMGRQEEMCGAKRRLRRFFSARNAEGGSIVAAEHGVLLRFIFIFVSILNHACYQAYSFIHIVSFAAKGRFVLYS